MIIKFWEHIVKRVLTKEYAIILFTVIFSIISGVLVFTCTNKQVVIAYSGKKIETKTLKSTVKEVLKQHNIKVNQYDQVYPALDTKLKRLNKNIINIKQAVPVQIIADGKTSNVMTCESTIKGVLENANIKISPLDKLAGASLNDRIVRDMKVKVIRVQEKIVAENVSIPYQTITKENFHLQKGVNKVVREGKQGTKEKSFKVILEDGKEVAKSLIKEAILASPLDMIIEKGTLTAVKTSRGENFRYKRVLNMVSTAYTASYRDTGKHPGSRGFGITFTGKTVRRGIVAVDRRVIPLHSKLYIEGIGNVPDYGIAYAEDIGGAIKGNRIDLYYDDQSTADRWGRRTVRVYILED